MFQNTWLNGFEWGVVAGVGAWYGLSRFAPVIWRDIKAVAYKVWDYIRTPFTKA